MTRSDLSGDSIGLNTLVSQLAQAVGEEKAREVIVEAAAELGVQSEIMSRERALEVLACVAETPGIVGVCARFARTRVMLAGVSLSSK